jgi:hypothetical protein
MSKAIHNINLNLPDGWENKTIYTYMGPDDSGVQHILTLVVDEDVEGMDLAEFAGERIDVIKENMSSIRVLKDELKELPSGRTVHEFVYKWIPSEDKIIFQKVVYLLINDIGYTFSCNFSKKTIKTIGLQVDQIIDSFNREDEEEEDE